MEKSNQHYIPKFYLEYFTDHNIPAIYTPYVWFYDKINKQFDNKAPVNIAAENGYNNIIDKNGNVTSIVEDQFQKIENSASKIFRNKIINLKFISKNERLILAKFVFSMLERVPQFKEIYIETVKNGCLNSYIKEHSKNIKLEDIPPQLMMDSVIRTTDKASHILLNLDWSLLIAPKGISFITSDNPVIIRDAKLNQLTCGGFLNVNAEVNFPLTDSICLFGSWGRHTRVVKEISKNEVAYINYLTSINSYRYLFSNSQNLLKEIVDSTKVFYE